MLNSSISTAFTFPSKLTITPSHGVGASVLINFAPPESPALAPSPTPPEISPGNFSPTARAAVTQKTVGAQNLPIPPILLFLACSSLEPWVCKPHELFAVILQMSTCSCSDCLSPKIGSLQTSQTPFALADSMQPQLGRYPVLAPQCNMYRRHLALVYSTARQAFSPQVWL